MSKAILISRLEQLLNTFHQKYSDRENDTIYGKFPPTLFSENYETFGFYWNELEKTLQQIKSIPIENEEELSFFCNKLIGQYNILQEKLELSHKRKNQNYYKKKVKEPGAVYSAKERQQQRDNSLPPRERLTKYYFYLNTFNEKIKALEDAIFKVNDELEKTRFEQLLIHTKERRLRCLNAIEILEEYLTYKDLTSSPR